LNDEELGNAKINKTATIAVENQTVSLSETQSHVEGSPTNQKQLKAAAKETTTPIRSANLASGALLSE